MGFEDRAVFPPQLERDGIAIVLDLHNRFGEGRFQSKQLFVHRVARDEAARDAKSLIPHDKCLADRHTGRNGDPLQPLHVIPCLVHCAAPLRGADNDVLRPGWALEVVVHRLAGACHSCASRRPHAQAVAAPSPSGRQLVPAEDVRSGGACATMGASVGAIVCRTGRVEVHAVAAGICCLPCRAPRLTSGNL